MDKKHFYQRLTRWQHLRFNDVVSRERPDAQAWDKKYEIYIQDKTKSSAQLYIRTTQPGEDVIQVLAEYLCWLEDYNLNGAPAVSDATSSFSQRNESCRTRSGNHQPRIHTPTAAAAARFTRTLS